MSYRITIDGQPFEVSDKDSAAKLLKDARELAFRNPHLPVPKIGYSSRDLRPLATQTQRDIKADKQAEEERLLLLM
jgi:hypothetical protein